MKTGRYGRRFCMAVGFIVAFIWPARAQESSGVRKQNYSDKGTFRILQSGKEIGKEVFQIVPESSGWKCTAEINLRPKGQDPIQVRTETNIDANGLFRTYEAQRTGDGPKMHLRVFLEDGIAICEEKEALSSETTPVKVNPDFQILDINVFHHYSVLAMRMAMNPQLDQLQVLIPQEAVAGNVSMKNVSKDMMKVGKNKVPVNRYDLDSGELKLSLWIDDTGKLYRIQVPQTDAEVTRLE